MPALAASAAIVIMRAMRSARRRTPSTSHLPLLTRGF
jgi:hypothetical protein